MSRFWILSEHLRSCALFLISGYLGEKGEMSCLSLAQLIVGGGTLWTSQGKTAS